MLNPMATLLSKHRVGWRNIPAVGGGVTELWPYLLLCHPNIDFPSASFFVGFVVFKRYEAALCRIYLNVPIVSKIQGVPEFIYGHRCCNPQHAPLSPVSPDKTARTLPNCF